MNDSTLPPSERVKANNKTKIIDATASTSSSSSIKAKSAALLSKSRQRKKGFGLSDWNNLLRHTNDLAQRNGRPLRHDITIDELRQHNSIHDGWIVLNGNKVYNVTPYLHYHPGGVEIMKQVLGKKDAASKLYDKYHPWVNADGLIGKLHIGYLAPESKHDDDDDNNNRSYVPKQILSNDGFPIPAPRPPKNSNKTTSSIPSVSLSSKEKDEEDENDLNPWEK